MSESNYIVVKPDLRYKSAPDADLSFVTELNQTQSQVIDYDRTVNVNLATLFDAERQKSVLFRPTVKLSYIYENNLVGYSNYKPYRDNLYYINPELSVINGVWSGLPTYQEFEFIRTDINSTQLNFVAKSEGVTAESEALHLIAQKSDGAMRDSLSLFDRLISFSDKIFLLFKILPR